MGFWVIAEKKITSSGFCGMLFEIRKIRKYATTARYASADSALTAAVYVRDSLEYRQISSTQHSAKFGGMLSAADSSSTLCQFWHRVGARKDALSPSVAPRGRRFRRRRHPYPALSRRGKYAVFLANTPVREKNKIKVRGRTEPRTGHNAPQCGSFRGTSLRGRFPGFPKITVL